MRVAFFGSPAFALPSLRVIAERHEVVLVVSQPDKPAGRGMKRSRPAVAEEAVRLGLPLDQPSRLRGNDEFARRLGEARPQVAVTVAYGKILPPPILELPRAGFLNVHASLLPRYRGAAPIQWALINGEPETGVSIMQTEAGLDTGPVCLVRKTPIGGDELAPELFERLALLGAEAIGDALALLEEGRLECRPQDPAQATYAPPLEKADGQLDWQEGARSLYDRFRGVCHWPGATFEWAGRTVRVHEMGPCEGAGEPGEVLRVGADGVTVATGAGAVELRTVQPAGKPRLPARDWANGYRVKAGVRIA